MPSGGWRKQGARRRAQGLEGGAGTLTQVATFTGEIRGPCPHCGLQAGPSPKLEYAATDTRRGLSQPKSRCWVRAREEKGPALGSRLVLAIGPQVQVLTSQGPQACGVLCHPHESPPPFQAVTAGNPAGLLCLTALLPVRPLLCVSHCFSN